jgi:hypothetical protein
VQEPRRTIPPAIPKYQQPNDGAVNIQSSRHAVRQPVGLAIRLNGREQR